MGSLVEVAVTKAISSLTERRAELAEEVIRSDTVIDDKEVRIEVECMKSARAPPARRQRSRGS